jgi:hypothetical protein
MTTRQEQIEKQKPKRVPLGRRNILTVSGLKDTEDFHYHWFNDSGDRLWKCLEAGYAFVNRSGLSAGDTTVESARGTDSLMKKGVGGGFTAFLMRIPMEIYKEDQARKQEEVDAIETEMKRASKVEGSYGKITVTR